MLFQDIGKILSNSELVGYVFQGLGTTLLVTLIAAVMGLVLGFIVAIIKMAAKQNKYMKIPAFI